MYRVGALFFFLICNYVYGEKEHYKQSINKKYEIDSSSIKNYREYIFQLAFCAFKNQNYIRTKILLNKYILDNRIEDDIYKYSLFYYSLACYKLKNFDVAYYNLKYLSKIFPTWEKIDEVKYWLSVLAFEKKLYKQGITYLNTIFLKSSSKAKKLKLFYLDKINDFKIYVNLLKKFPNDKIILKTCAKFLIENKNLNLKQGYINKIIKKFKIPVYQFDTIKKLKSHKKNSYNICVLLPFICDEQQLNDTKNKFILDFYQGLRLGSVLLKKEGIKIKIYAYDTESKVEKIKEILNKEEIKNMDLIIGPLFKNEFEIAQKFAQKYQINIISPFSISDIQIKKNPFLFLFNSGIETLALKAAKYLSSKIHNKRIVVVGSDTKEDLKYMNDFCRFYKSLSKRDVYKIVLKNSNTSYFLNNFRRPKNYNKLTEEEKQQIEENKSMFDDVDVLYIASLNKLLIGNILTILKIRNLYPLILGHYHWLRYDYFNFEILNSYKILFISPSYISKNNHYYKKFQINFIKKFKELPTDFSFVGYELIDFFSRQLNSNGIYFQNKISIFPRFENLSFYNRFQDNQYCPILEFKQGEFKIVG